MPTTDIPHKAIVTVSAANTAELPAVPMASGIDSVTAMPLHQVVTVAGEDEQAVVDTAGQAQHDRDSGRVGFHDIEVQWRWLSNQNDTATYAILGEDGRQIGTYKAHLRVTGGDGVPSWTNETTLGVRSASVGAAGRGHQPVDGGLQLG